NLVIGTTWTMIVFGFFGIDVLEGKEQATGLSANEEKLQEELNNLWGGWKNVNLSENIMFDATESVSDPKTVLEKGEEIKEGDLDGTQLSEVGRVREDKRGSVEAGISNVKNTRGRF
ncbi:hypothetical protein ACJX0J_007854, partial [Zea mays]